MATSLIKKTKFVDIDLNFSLHPISGDIGKRVDVNAIINAIKNLVMTRRYDRLFHPEMYCQASDMLFENMTPSTVVTIETTIKNVIKNFEPRVEVQYVSAQIFPEDTHLYVEIAFNIIGMTETIKTNFYLERSL